MAGFLAPPGGIGSPGPGGGGITGPGGITIYAPPRGGTTTPPTTKKPDPLAPVTPGDVSGALGTATSLISCLASPGTCLLRLVLLIIGLICIAGAIYLYKPTSELIAAPARAARDAVGAAAVA